MNKRLLTAVLGVPLVIGFVWIGGLAFGAFVIMLEIIILKEYFNMLSFGEGSEKIKSLMFIISIIWGIGYTVALDLSVTREIMMPMVIILFALFAFIAIVSVPRIEFTEFAVSFTGTVYVVMFLNYLLLIRRTSDGLHAFIALLVIIWTCDTVAYFVGVKFGKRRLAPLISPKKSWEGAIGGYMASGIAFLIFAHFFLTVTRSNMIFIALVIPAIAQMGDLIESYIKRQFSVKDSGNFLPGHGGLFDRFDSMLFSAPFYFYLLIWTIG